MAWTLGWVDNPLDDAETFKLDNILKNESQTIKEWRSIYRTNKNIKKWLVMNKHISVIKKRLKNWYNSLLNTFIFKKVKIRTIPISDKLGEVDTLNDYKLYKKLLTKITSNGWDKKD